MPIELNNYGDPLQPSSSVQSLLQQTSAEIKQKRRGEMVEFDEIKKIILDFPNTPDPKEIYKIIGLSPRTYNEDKQKNQARKTTKYALLGLLAEQQQNKNHHFTPAELNIIFAAITHHISTRTEPYQDEVKQIQKIVMNMIVDG